MSSGAEHCVCVTFYTTKDVRIAGWLRPSVTHSQGGPLHSACQKAEGELWCMPDSCLYQEKNHMLWIIPLFWRCFGQQAFKSALDFLQLISKILFTTQRQIQHRKPSFYSLCMSNIWLGLKWQDHIWEEVEKWSKAASGLKKQYQVVTCFGWSGGGGGYSFPCSEKLFSLFGSWLQLSVEFLHLCKLNGLIKSQILNRLSKQINTIIGASSGLRIYKYHTKKPISKSSCLHNKNWTNQNGFNSKKTVKGMEQFKDETKIKHLGLIRLGQKSNQNMMTGEWIIKWPVGE